MQEYYFLFGVVLVWMFFAVWQDMKTREIYNWLNFSLLGIALAYKAFLSFNRNDSSVFLISIAGALVFYGLANLFYYGKAFAGGDAKLLIAVGAALPYESYLDILILGGAFVFLLFLMGAMYSLVYSLFIVGRNMKRFRKDISKRIKKLGYWNYVLLILAFVFSVLTLNSFYYFFFLVLSLMPFIYIYLKSVEGLMIGLREGKDLREGDWLERSVKLGKRKIECNVHGLSWVEIKLIRKYGKKVMIRDGIPFGPAFLIAWIVMLYAFLVLGSETLEFFSLFSF